MITFSFAGNDTALEYCVSCEMLWRMQIWRFALLLHISNWYRTAFMKIHIHSEWISCSLPEHSSNCALHFSHEIFSMWFSVLHSRRFFVLDVFFLRLCTAKHFARFGLKKRVFRNDAHFHRCVCQNEKNARKQSITQQKSNTKNAHTTQREGETGKWNCEFSTSIDRLVYNPLSTAGK